jgi:hypothetical protein
MESGKWATDTILFEPGLFPVAKDAELIVDKNNWCAAIVFVGFG